MTLRFGTDGVRGPAEQFTASFVRALGRAAATVLGGDTGGFVIGRDTRESGARIESLLVDGLVLGGATPTSMGVVPTPAVAWVCARRDLPGAVISASHNPWSDNGIKFFAAGGRKLPDDLEERIETLLDSLLAEMIENADDATDTRDANGTNGTDVAREVHVARDDAAVAQWCDAVVASAPTLTRDAADTTVRVDSPVRVDNPVRVVIDCANGAASTVAPVILGSLGVDVEVLHASPDGRNINASCGSTHPEDLQRRVVESGALLGLAFDGDADRLVAVDELGRLVDGDQLLAMFAADLRARDALHNDVVVVTVMTNLGFRLAMAERGITVVDTPVGDRHVIEALERTSGSLGGEQSGHLVFADLATTGDGVLAGVQLIDLVVRAGRPLSELADASMRKLPQVLVNVAVERRRVDIAEAIASEIAAAEAELAGGGRVLIRPSGTEPLVRVMVEAATTQQAQDIATTLATSVQQACRA